MVREYFVVSESQNHPEGRQGGRTVSQCFDQVDLRHLSEVACVQGKIAVSSFESCFAGHAVASGGVVEGGLGCLKEPANQHVNGTVPGCSRL